MPSPITRTARTARTAMAYGLGLGAQLSAGTYVWPSAYDRMEDLYSLQAGVVREGFADAVRPCSFGTNRAGVQNAAEWIRTAYHDMATADVAAGTGGLDGSIQFETGRAENEGAAFNHTLGFFASYYDAYTPLADLIALGVVTATDACGGPLVEFRAGRDDAVREGPAGVPKPEEDLAAHTAAFARQGFTQEDMIALVACGHTLGGVHHEDFPQIVGDPDATPGNTTTFEGGDSASAFDNRVVAEYLDGTTPNPLVVSPNATFHSDRRVFSADGNTTVRALANPAVFSATCADVLARMINTVPAYVTLSEPIAPVDIKPYISALALASNSSIAIAGRIRVRLDRDATRDMADMRIDLVYFDRSGSPVAAPISATPLTLQGGLSSGMHRATFGWFNFAADLPAAAGISRFLVRMTKPSTGAVSVYDNAGHGFPVDDALLYQEAQSCLIQDPGNKHSLTVVAAVRNDRVHDTLTLDVNYKTSRLEQSMVPLLSKQSANLAATGRTEGDYTLFNITLPMDEKAWFTALFDLSLGPSAAAATKLLRRSASVIQRSCADL